MTLGYIEAEYESGYVHRESDEDHSPYVRGKNIFNDILERRPEAIHGKMVRFSLQLADERLDVDWTILPDNARPVRFKHMEGDFRDGGIVDARMVSIDFGYQYTDGDGVNHQEIEEIR
jgi:hypothetical protein